MIKAEIISHEGNPGPNWLDHCRTLVTPATATVAVLVVAAGSIGFVSLERHRSATTAQRLPASSQSQPVNYTSGTGLQVTPLQTVSQPASSQAAQVQNAGGGTAKTVTTDPNNNAATTLGPSVTPSPSSSAQTLLPSATGAIHSSVNGLTNGLGL